MWVYTRQRNEQDKRMLINLSLHSAIQIVQLGNKWFVEVVIGTDSSSLASVDSQEEADGLLKQIFDSLHSDEKAIDLNTPRESNRSD